MSDTMCDHIPQLFSVYNGKTEPMNFFRTTSGRHNPGVCEESRRVKKRMTHPSISSQEEPSFDSIFDKFRNIPGVDILWVKEQIYGTPCIPESCPKTRSMVEVCGSLSGSSELELEEGEVRENKRPI